MTTPTEWDAWGSSIAWDANTGTWDDFHLQVTIPAFPACSYWEDDPSTHAYMRLRVRAMVTVPDPSPKEYEFALILGSSDEDSESSLIKGLGSLTEEWTDENWATCLGYDAPYKHSATNAKSSDGYVASTSMPRWKQSANIVGCSNADTTDVVTVYGFQLGVDHSDACAERDLEQFDWSGSGYMYAENSSAPSCLISLGLITAYNRILYYATWQMSIAV